MWLLEYVYFQSFRWMHRQGRKPRDAVAMSEGPLITSLGIYLVGLVPVLYHWQGINLIHLVADHWPAITEHGKYLKPTHGLALLIGIAVIVFVHLRFHRKVRREAIVQWFSTASEREVRNGCWVVLAFFFGSIAFAVSSVFAVYPVMWLIVFGLIVGNVVVYRRHYRGRNRS